MELLGRRFAFILVSLVGALLFLPGGLVAFGSSHAAATPAHGPILALAPGYLPPARTPAFVNVTSSVAPSNWLAWSAMSVFDPNAPTPSYLTVGGNGITLYNTTGTTWSPPTSISFSGFMLGAASAGSQELLVGQQYSPTAGVLMDDYFPGNNTLRSLTSLFPHTYQKSNATLVSATWSGGSFYILGLNNTYTPPPPWPPASLLLYRYNPATNSLTNLTKQIPTSFRMATRCSCSAGYGVLWADSRLFILSTSFQGNGLLGSLQGGRFTNLSSILPLGFRPTDGDGSVSLFAAPSMAWNGSALVLDGRLSSGAMSLVTVNPRTNASSDYSTLLSGYRGQITQIAVHGHWAYLGGYEQPSASNLPFVAAVDLSSKTLSNWSGYVPSSWGALQTLAEDGSTLFFCAGSFNSLHYGLLKHV